MKNAEKLEIRKCIYQAICQLGSNIENEINTKDAMNGKLAQTIINCDEEKKYFFMSVAKKDE